MAKDTNQNQEPAFRITRAENIAAPISAAKSKDGVEHKAPRLIPLAFAASEDRDAFIAGIDAYLALNQAIATGKQGVLVTRTGLEKPITASTDEQQTEHKSLLAKVGLPQTYGDVIAALNKAVVTAQRSKANAWVNKQFGKGKVAAADEEEGISDDIAV